LELFLPPPPQFIFMSQKQVEALKQQIASLKQKLSSFEKVTRSKIGSMSSEVIDSNPYSRLMALKRMGIVSNYEVPYPHSLVVVFSFV